jgi:hypothetical protein
MKTRPPSYRLHRPSGRAVVTLDNRDYYLGRFDTPESHSEYDRLVAEWLANGRQLAASKPGAARRCSIVELVVAFTEHAELYYRTPDGEPTAEIANFRAAIEPVPAYAPHRLNPSVPIGPGAFGLRAYGAAGAIRARAGSFPSTTPVASRPTGSWALRDQRSQQSAGPVHRALAPSLSVRR